MNKMENNDIKDMFMKYEEINGSRKNCPLLEILKCYFCLEYCRQNYNKCEIYSSYKTREIEEKANA